MLNRLITFVRRLVGWLVRWLGIQAEPTFGWRIPWRIPEEKAEQGQ